MRSSDFAALCGFALALVFAGAARAGDFEIGQAAAQSGDYATAAQLWKPLAKSGDAEAAYNLGVLYDQGLGVRSDPAQAIQLYRKAAAGGVVDAEVNLGIHYAQGVGVVRDPVQAARWFHKAAAGGSQDAKTDLALLQDPGAKQDAANAAAAPAAAPPLPPPKTSSAPRPHAQSAVDSAEAGAFASPQASPDTRPQALPETPATPAASSRAKPDTDGDGQVHWAQIGAFPDQASAQERWREIEKRLPAEAPGHSCRVERVVRDDVTLVRALVGPFHSAELVEAFCHKVSAIKRECLAR